MYHQKRDLDNLKRASDRWQELCVPGLKTVPDKWGLQYAYDTVLDDLREQTSMLNEITELLRYFGANLKDRVPPQKHPIKLRLFEILNAHFDDGELRTLCFYLDVDYDNLTGGKVGKMRELVNYLERRQRIPDLVTIGKRLRSDVSWQDVSQATMEASFTPSTREERLQTVYDRLLNLRGTLWVVLTVADKAIVRLVDRLKTLDWRMVL